jgi:TatD DNase family protein
MKLIDTHAHLYSQKFDEDRDEVMQRAFDEGVDKIFLPNVDSKSIEGMFALEKEYPDKVFALMGLHPCSVQDGYETELNIVEKWLGERSYKAIGEIGIDLYWDKSTIDIQKIAFRRQISWAKELNIPIVIHARESLDEIISIIREEKDERLTGIFHCFTGTLEHAHQIMDLEFHMGLGGVLTFKKSGLDKVVSDIPMDYLVLETDAPYLSPTPKRGKRNESSYIKHIAEKLAAIKGLSTDKVAKITTENALTVFQV